MPISRNARIWPDSEYVIIIIIIIIAELQLIIIMTTRKYTHYADVEVDREQISFFSKAALR